MAEDVAAAGTDTQNGADDRTLLDDLTVLAQPVGTAPQSGEARQAQDSEKSGGINELAAVHQGTPDLAARFIPAAPDLAGAKDSGDVVRSPDAGASGALAGIENAKPVGPENTPRADGSEAVSSLTLPTSDGGRQGGGAIAAAPQTDDATRRDPAAPTVQAAPAPAQSTAPASAPVVHTVTEPQAETVKPQVVDVQATPAHVGTPTVTVAPGSGNEDNSIALDIKALTTDSGDSISSITITGVPTGAVLNHGTSNADGTWTLSTADLAGLRVTPASHDAHDFTLTITATASDTNSNGTETATATSAPISLHVEVIGVDQAPVITQSAAASGNEDTRIAVNLNLGTFKADESLTGLTITSQTGSDAANSTALAGSSFTTGTGASVGSYDAASHSWSFTASEVSSIQTSGLYVKPPQDWNDDVSANHNTGLALTATIASQETDPDTHAVTTASTPLNLSVHVAGVADTPTVTASDATTTEDNSVALTIASHLTDITNTEVISAVTITGVPTGASLNHGTHNADGSWTLSTADLAGLRLSPAAHDAHDFTLTITTTSTEQGSNIAVQNAVSAPVSLHVAVTGVDQVPVITQSAAASGNEDTRIAVNLNLGTFKADESLTGLTITSQTGSDAANSTALAGSSFTTGTGASVGSYDAASHSWSFTASEVSSIQTSGLYVKPPQDWNDDVSANHNTGLALTATIASQETDPDTHAVTTASTPLNLSVHVAGVADTPTVTASDATTTEDNSVALTIASHLTDITNTEVISAVTITGVPTGASLNHGTHNADGSWTLSTADLAGLRLSPAAHDAHDFTLTITTTSTEQGSNIAVQNAVSAPVTLHVTVDGVAHVPTETVSASLSGNEDTRVAIDLNLSTFKADESLSGLTIASQSGANAANSTALAGSSFTTGTGASVGTYDAAHGQWVFTANEVSTIKASGLYVQAPHDWSDWSSAGNNSGLKLTATVTASETDPDTHAVTTATTSQNTAVHFLGVADAPSVTTVDAAATQNLGNGASSNWIALSITPHLADTDGSESISSLKISNLPSGAVLNQGTDNHDGSWTLTQAQLSGLKILPAAHDASDFTLYVTATSTEAGPNVATGLGSATSAQAAIHVTVEATAEAPVVTQTAAVGNEDTHINVNLTLNLNDAAESYTGLTLTGVTPSSHFYSSTGVALGAETSSGNWSFSTADIASIRSGGLFVQPPTNWSDWNTTGNTAGMQFTAALSATKTDPDSGLVHNTTTTQALAVEVKSVADTPTAMTTSAAHGSEYDGSHADWIPLTISSPALTDTDGSETLSVTIAGVPSTALLNHGSYNSSTKLWTVASTDLADLKVQPGAHDAKDFTLTITATATEGGVASHIATATASTSATLVVTVDGVADTPTISQTTAAIGNEDSRINLNLAPQLTDTGETLTMTLSGVPTGSHFYSAASGSTAVGTDNGNGTWTFSSDDMAAIKASGHALYVQPPSNWSDWNTAGNTTGMQLTASLTSTQTDPDTNAVTSATAAPFSFGVEVKSVADVPSVTTVAASGHESDGVNANWIPLSITTGVTDADGSESITSVVISGVPTGAQLQLANGTILSGASSFTLSQADLAGLKIQPATHDVKDFTLTIASTSTEAGVASHIDTATATTTSTLKVSVAGVADTPTITQTTAASGNEDSRIDLHLNPQLADSGEYLTMSLSGVPTGSHFYTAASGGSAVGTDNGNGTWSFSQADMNAVKAAGLFVQAPTNWSDYSTATHNSGMSLTATLTSNQYDSDSKLTTSASATPIVIGVEVKSVADTPTVTVTNATVSQNDGSGAGANWVALSISSAVTDTDGSEVISAITIKGVPTGALLNHGTDNHDGSWTLSSADLTGLKILPPAHSATDFNLTVVATATEQGDASHIAVLNADSAGQTLKVTVTGQAETPVLGQTSAAMGNEDTRINVNLSVVLPGTGETVTGMTIKNVPAGSVFYASEDASDSTKLGTYDGATGTWSFTAAEVSTIQSAGHGLFVQPPRDWSDYSTTGHTTGMQLLTTINAKEVDPDTNAVTTSSTTQTLAVEVKSVADAPTVTASAARGNEDTAIALNITPHLTDVDGSESISALTITGVPTGAVLNHGTHNGDGSWTLSAADLTGLTITPPADSKTAFTLHITATSTEGGNAAHIAVASATSPVVDLKVTVDAVADTPTVTVAPSTGNEDSWISLSITAATPDTSGTEIVTVAITGVPSGAILNHGTYNSTSGTWTVSQNDLADLKILPPKDSNADFTLHAQAITTEPSSGSTNHSDMFDVTVTVTGTAERPNFTETAHALGLEDTRINLNLTGSLTDTNEVLTLKLAGIPAGSHFFSAASAQMVNGADSTAIGHDNSDGTWSFTAAEVAAIKAGGIYLQPPTDWSDWSGISHSSNAWTEWNPGQGGINVTATLTSTDTDVNTGVTTPADTNINFTVHVTGVADAANGLPAGHFVASAAEDNATHGTLVDLGFGQLSLKDFDGSEHLSVVISGLPAGTSLEFANGVSIANLVPIAAGKWSVEAQYLSSLRLRVGENVNSDVVGTLHLNADVVTTEVDGNVHVDSRIVDVTVTPVTDSAHISGGATGSEEHAIGLNLSVTPCGTAETMDSVTLDLSNAVAAGAVVRYGTDVITPDASGHYTLTAAQMADPSQFTVTTPTNWSDWSSANHNTGILIGVTATTHDHTAAQLVTSQTLAVHVSGVADTPSFSALSAVTINPAAGGSAATTATLDVASKVALTDADTSERLWMIVDGLPDGALLTTSTGALAGYSEGGGKWIVTADQWDSAVAGGGFRVVVPHGLADPTSHASITSATVTVTALSTERDDGSTASTSQSFTLTWSGTVDTGTGVGVVTDPTAPTVTVGTATGNEDSAIALNISIPAHAGLTASVVIDAASLNGGTLSAGIYDPVHNTYTVPESAIASLTITPAHNWNSAQAGTDLSLSAKVVFVDTANGGTSSTALTIPVHVNPVTDTPSISGSGSGLEDTAISLNLADSVGATGETITGVTLGGVPTGATITKADGTVVSPDSAGGSTYTLTGMSASDLGGLKIIPPHNWSNYSGSISLDVAVTAQDHGATAVTAHKTVSVSVTGVTDLADVSASAVHGAENQWIDLSTSLHAALTDTDGSEGISLVLSNVPNGAVLNHGYNNGDGTWRLDAADLPTLKILMPTDFNGQQSMSLKALTWEKDGSDGLKTATADFTVTVDAAAETPAVSVTSARGNEDSGIALTISANVVHALGTDHIDHITITGLPSGASLNHGTQNGDGSWTLSAADLAGLTITPPSHSDAGFTLQVTATASETDAISGQVSTTTSTAASLTVKVDAVANGGTVSVSDASGAENAWIDLSGKITPHLVDTDGSETVTAVVISGMPSGAVLNHGTHNADGLWTVAPSDLASLKLLPATNSAHDLTLSAAATTTESANGSSATGAAVSFTVTVDAVAAPVSLTQSAPAAGTEDSRINLNLSALVSDSNETATLTISGVPSGSHFFNAGADGAAIGTDNGNGSWSFTAAELADMQASGHGLYVQPPTNWSDWSSTGHTAGMQLSATVNASVTDPDTHAVSSTSSTLGLTVHVDSVADAPVVTVTQAQGTEDSWINLSITPTLADTTGSEYISAVTITGLPSGATLNHGVANADGSWTLQSADLAGLQVKPGSHAVTDFTLTVTATSHDWQNSDTASTSQTLHVVVDAQANAPTLSQTAASSGSEDSRINLNLAAALTDSQESLSLSIANIPAGSHFYSAATGATDIGHDNGNGTWSFTTAEVAQIQSGGLFIQPPANWSDWNSASHTTGLQLSATLTSTQTDPDTQAVTSATTVQTLAVHVASVADAPTVTVADAVTTVNAPVALSISPLLTDTDGSESISAVTITGVPTGASLSAGIHNADGSWTLTQAQLSGLKLTPANDDAHDLTLHVTATSTEAAGGSATSASYDLHVTVNEVAHAPTLTLPLTVTGNEDSPINLALAVASADAHESLSLSLSGVPADFHFVSQVGGVDIGTHNADGNWSFSAAEIAQIQTSGHGLYLEPSANWSDWNTQDHAGLAISATLTSTTATDPDTATAATASTQSSFTLHVASVADTPSLTASGVVGTAGAATPLSIASALTDTDGSESLRVTLSGLAADETLNHGTHNADGSWTLTSGDLTGLSISSGSGDAGASTLHVTATSTEALGGSSSSLSADFSLKLNSANLGSMDATDSHLLHFDSLPAAPANGSQLAEFVFGSLDGIHSLDVTGVNQSQHLGSFSFDAGNEHVAIAAGTHGFIDGNGIHTIGQNGTESVQHLDPAAFIDSNAIHGTLTFDSTVVLHVEGLDKITF